MAAAVQRVIEKPIKVVSESKIAVKSAQVPKKEVKTTKPKVCCVKKLIVLPGKCEVRLQ